MADAAPRAAPGGGYEAVLFDALGTLVELEPPWPLLQAALADAHGIELGEDEAKHAMVAEMTYYKRHHVEGRDESSLEELRARCAAVLQKQLPAAAALSPAEMREALMRSLRFRPYPDVAPLLGRLRLLGTRTAVVSNWDVSLRAILSELGLGGLFDEVVVSAEAGVTKPGKDIFELALERLGSPARKALFVGDSLETDVAGALGAGIRGVLLDRAGKAAVEPGVERILTLEAVGELVAPPPATLRA